MSQFIWVYTGDKVFTKIDLSLARFPYNHQRKESLRITCECPEPLLTVEGAERDLVW